MPRNDLPLRGIQARHYAASFLLSFGTEGAVSLSGLSAVSLIRTDAGLAAISTCSPVCGFRPTRFFVAFRSAGSTTSPAHFTRPQFATARPTTVWSESRKNFTSALLYSVSSARRDWKSVCVTIGRGISRLLVENGLIRGRVG